MESPDAQESTELRRLLREMSERVQRLEAERDLANAQARDLSRSLTQDSRDLVEGMWREPVRKLEAAMGLEPVAGMSPRDALARCTRDVEVVAKTLVPLRDARHWPPPALVPVVEDVAQWVLGLVRERGERIMHVFGCAGCSGEHRDIWTQELKPPAKYGVGTPEVPFLMCQRAYVCPVEYVVVLVSNESEETFRGET